jgi:hypothetical protein
LVQVRWQGEGVQGTRGGMQRGVGDVEVEARAPQARVPQQQLDAAQVDAGFEQMGREAMTQERRINDLGELGGGARLAADMRNTRAGDRFGKAGTGQESGLELIELPGAAPQRQQGRGEHHEASAFPLALPHLDDQALGVDVGALELTEFGDPYVRGLEGGEDRAMLAVVWGQQ